MSALFTFFIGFLFGVSFSTLFIILIAIIRGQAAYEKDGPYG